MFVLRKHDYGQPCLARLIDAPRHLSANHLPATRRITASLCVRLPAPLHTSHLLRKKTVLTQVRHVDCGLAQITKKENLRKRTFYSWPKPVSSPAATQRRPTPLYLPGSDAPTRTPHPEFLLLKGALSILFDWISI